MTPRTEYNVAVRVLNYYGSKIRIKPGESCTGEEFEVGNGDEEKKVFASSKHGVLNALITPTDRNIQKGPLTKPVHLILEFLIKKPEEGKIKHITCSEENHMVLNKGNWGVLVINVEKNPLDDELPTNVEVGIDDPGKND